MKEFEHKYGMVPTESQLKQFVGWKESHSGNVWRNILKEIEAVQKRRAKIKKEKAKKSSMA